MRMISVVCGSGGGGGGVRGCLQKEVGQTIYLGPSGAVWTVIERDVRSDERSRGPGFARNRTTCSPRSPASTGWRGRFAARRPAGDDHVAPPGASLLRHDRGPVWGRSPAGHGDPAGGEIQGEVTLVREGCRTKFGVRVNLEVGAGVGRRQPAGRAPDRSRELPVIVLTEGRFISADGFEILGDGSIAVPDREKDSACPP